MLEQIWKEYGLYDYLQEDLQQIRIQREQIISINEQLMNLIHKQKWDNISLVQSQTNETKQRIEFEIRKEIKLAKEEKNRRIRERNLLYPKKMFIGFRMILEEATNQKQQLTQKIDELQLKEDYLFDEIAKIYRFNNYSELQLARNIPHL